MDAKLTGSTKKRSLPFYGSPPPKRPVTHHPPSPIAGLEVHSLTPNKNHVNATLYGQRITGDVNPTPVGMGGEKFVLLANFLACDRQYALHVPHPGRTLKPDPAGLYFGVRVNSVCSVGVSRIACGDLKALPDVPTDALIEQVILPYLDKIKVLHDEGTLHCDIKPDNGLFTKVGQNITRSEPSDFGMSQTIGQKRRFCGTFENIPPEVFAIYEAIVTKQRIPTIKSHQRQDVWALGSMIASLVTGKRLESVLNQTYNMPRHKETAHYIFNHKAFKHLPKANKRQEATKAVNRQYGRIYYSPDYSAQQTTDGFFEGITDPLKQQVLRCVQDCFNQNPHERPSVSELISKLSGLISTSSASSDGASSTRRPLIPAMSSIPADESSHLKRNCVESSNPQQLDANKENPPSKRGKTSSSAGTSSTRRPLMPLNRRGPVAENLNFTH